jgi:hypothetical protein
VVGNEGMQRIEASAPVYHEVARLYQIAKQLRPGGLDRWNGELYARFDDKWGGLGRDGTMRLNNDLVLRHLTGGQLSDNPEIQGQALATVLHESYHARSEFDARKEPNALRQPQSVGLDEGLTELAAVEDFRAFADQAGYEGVPQPSAEYPGAVRATSELLDHVSKNQADRDQLVNTALDSPVMMRWDKMADNVVRNDLPMVPPDPQHQQAARAHLVNQMAVPGWHGVHDRRDAGPIVAADTKAALDMARGQIEQHYRDNPGSPYPARTPNPAVNQQAATSNEQARGITPRGQQTDLATLPAPDATTRVGIPAATAPPSQQDLPPELRVLSGQAPAAHATRHAPSLGDGSRGSGKPHSSGVSRTPATRSSPGDHGRD